MPTGPRLFSFEEAKFDAEDPHQRFIEGKGALEISNADKYV